LEKGRVEGWSWGKEKFEIDKDERRGFKTPTEDDFN
jgi:hypothetical protein